MLSIICGNFQLWYRGVTLWLNLISTASPSLLFDRYQYHLVTHFYTALSEILTTSPPRIRAACVTTLLIVGAYFACVMPYTIAFIIWNKKHKSKESLMYESWPLYCKYNLPRHCRVFNLNFPFEKIFVHF